MKVYFYQTLLGTQNNNNSHKYNISKNNKHYTQASSVCFKQKNIDVQELFPRWLRKCLSKIDDWQNRVDNQILERSLRQTPDDIENARAAEDELKRMDYI